MRFFKRQFHVGIGLLDQKICGFMSEIVNEVGDRKLLVFLFTKLDCPMSAGRMFGVRETPFQQQWQLSW